MQLIDVRGRECSREVSVWRPPRPAYQKLATEAIAHLNKPGDPSAALVSIEPDTGYIRAMVGGTDYESSKFNLAAQGRRQPGSAFKPFCLTAAVELGIDPWKTYYMSMPLEITYPGATKPWKVRLRRQYLRYLHIVQATLRSDNTIYAQMALDVSARRIVDVAKRMGITSYLNPSPASRWEDSPRCLPLEMASAYGTLAKQGRAWAPTIVLQVKDLTRQGDLEGEPQGPQAIAAGVAYDVTRILSRTSCTARAPRPRSTARLPVRPVPPRTSATPGSADIRPTYRPLYGWVIPRGRYP
jgi:penicillin-binding protein 1A